EQQRRAKVGAGVNDTHRPLKNEWQRADLGSHSPRKGVKHSRHHYQDPAAEPRHKIAWTAEHNKKTDQQGDELIGQKNDFRVAPTRTVIIPRAPAEGHG